jgi:NAD(P)H-dependent FMN reductase
MLKLQIIIGSTREGRNADAIVRWVKPLAEANGSFDLELLDLRDWPLPMFRETLATVGDMRNPTYSDPLVKAWNAKIKEADAYLFITPEYNHSVPGELKNAIDSVFASYAFRHKPVGCVGYSIGAAAGVRAVEHLNQIMLEMEASPLRTQTLVPFMAQAFDAQGKAVNPVMNAGLVVMLEDLAWMGNALKTARAAGDIAPPTARFRAAMAALSAGK